MTILSHDRSSGSLLQRLFSPRGSSAVRQPERRGSLVDMPVPLIVREHEIRPTVMFQRVCETTRPDFTWAWHPGHRPLPENRPGLECCDPVGEHDLEVLKGLLLPGDSASPLPNCHHGTTIEVRLASFELREAVIRFGSRGVLYAVLDFERSFREIFQSAFDQMVPAYPIDATVVPLAITSYCGDRDQLRDPMGFIGVDFHLPCIGVVSAGDRAGEFVELSFTRLPWHCLRLEETLREGFIDLLVEGDR